MRLLLVKTSSLGDVIHTLPALSDAVAQQPGLQVDWVVEEGFAQIPAWHHAVDQVIPVAIRRWRKHWRRSWQQGEPQAIIRQLRQQPYDLVIDAQGLFKSAWITWFARGQVHGLDRQSAREGLASLFYRHRHRVARDQHAVERVRQLFAHSLGYSLDALSLQYGIAQHFVTTPPASTSPYVMFLHGTTWASKHWPEAYWRQLAEYTCAAGLQVFLPWGNPQEQQRAERIAKGLTGVQLLPPSTLVQLAGYLASAQACVAVDTGLGHLAAALEVPCLSLYGATNPGWTGAYGNGQQHLVVDYPCAPCLKRQCQVANPVQPACFTQWPAELVWARLQTVLMGK